MSLHVPFRQAPTSLADNMHSLQMRAISSLYTLLTQLPAQYITVPGGCPWVPFACSLQVGLVRLADEGTHAQWHVCNTAPIVLMGNTTLTKTSC